MINATVTNAGGMYDFFQFTRQVLLNLYNLERFPGDYLPSKGSIFEEKFPEYFRANPRGMQQFDFAFISWPRIKQSWDGKDPEHQPKKNNFHGLLFNKFWSEFLAQFVAEFGYRKVSQDFMADFLKLNTMDYHGTWAEQFHFHFLTPGSVCQSKEFWKQYLISQHRDSIKGLEKYDFSLMTYVQMNPLEIKTDRDIGFLDISPEKLRARVVQKLA